MLSIFQAETPEHIALAQELMTEYAQALEFNLCFQNFEKEMAELPGKYAPPAGRLFLAFWEGQPAGVIALRPMEDIAKCEMKRLYVRPAFRGHAIGRLLAEKAIAAARENGYTHMCLDTIQGKMDRAIRMYRELGFQETSAYYHNPMERVLYMELPLHTLVQNRQ
ncbi:MAG: GNAT family N-acetyltransferase [Acidobacteriia bacterium]|nr:GNAT family N-acetyltransferase [Terriglobia bacterium]